MDSLNSIEVQNIRHIGSSCTNLCDKITYYKTLTQDTQITDVMDKICTNLSKVKTDLSGLL